MPPPAILLGETLPLRVPVWAVDPAHRFAVRVEPISLEGITASVWTPPGEPEPATDDVRAAVTVWVRAIEQRAVPARWDYQWPCPAGQEPEGWLRVDSSDPDIEFRGVLKLPEFRLFQQTANGGLWSATASATEAAEALQFLLSNPTA